eukprot:6756853-Prymnesium_polylepis.1
MAWLRLEGGGMRTAAGGAPARASERLELSRARERSHPREPCGSYAEARAQPHALVALHAAGGVARNSSATIAPPFARAPAAQDAISRANRRLDVKLKLLRGEPYLRSRLEERANAAKN